MNKDEMEALVNYAESICLKFVAKVEDGRARSRETYFDCKNWLGLLQSCRRGDNLSEDE